MDATSIARPVPASQAEKANMSTGRRENDVAWFSTGQSDKAMYIDSIMLSRHSRAEIRCVRWKASPKLLNTKVE